MHNRKSSWTLTAALLLAPVAAAQSCPDRGSEWQRALTMAGPLIYCHWGAWPSWHLYTPAHRRIVPKQRMTVGDARPLARWLVRYGCRDYLTAPLPPPRVAVSGWVYDVPEAPCGQPGSRTGLRTGPDAAGASPLAREPDTADEVGADVRHRARHVDDAIGTDDQRDQLRLHANLAQDNGDQRQ